MMRLLLHNNLRVLCGCHKPWNDMKMPDTEVIYMRFRIAILFVEFIKWDKERKNGIRRSLNIWWWRLWYSTGCRQRIACNSLNGSKRGDVRPQRISATMRYENSVTTCQVLNWKLIEVSIHLKRLINNSNLRHIQHMQDGLRNPNAVLNIDNIGSIGAILIDIKASSCLHKHSFLARSSLANNIAHWKRLTHGRRVNLRII